MGVLNLTVTRQIHSYASPFYTALFQHSPSSKFRLIFTQPARSTITARTITARTAYATSTASPSLAYKYYDMHIMS